MSWYNSLFLGTRRSWGDNEYNSPLYGKLFPLRVPSSSSPSLQQRLAWARPMGTQVISTTWKWNRPYTNRCISTSVSMPSQTATRVLRWAYSLCTRLESKIRHIIALSYHPSDCTGSPCIACVSIILPPYREGCLHFVFCHVRYTVLPDPVGHGSTPQRGLNSHTVPDLAKVGQNSHSGCCGISNSMTVCLAFIVLL